MRYWELVEEPKNVDVINNPEVRNQLIPILKSFLLRVREKQIQGKETKTKELYQMLKGLPFIQPGLYLSDPKRLKDTIVDMMGQDKELEGLVDFIPFDNPDETIKLPDNKEDIGSQGGSKDGDKEKISKMAKDKATSDLKKGQ